MKTQTRRSFVLLASIALLSWTAAAIAEEPANSPDKVRSEASSSSGAPDSKPDAQGWITLFDGKNLDAWKKPAADKWRIVDGLLTKDKQTGDIWTKAVFGNFTIDLEVKCAKNTNSGVYLRGPVQYWHGMEIQVYHPVGNKKPGVHDMGALYDCLAPTVHAEKPVGEWNHLVITLVDNSLTVVLNDKQVVQADLDRWTEVKKNPDGTPNKFDWAIKDLPKTGHIGLQDHGTVVWYRNIRIKPLGKK